MTDLKEGYQRHPYPFATKRYCQILRLKADSEKIEQYKYWHQSKNIWKEIPEGIRKAGILDMELYLLGDMEIMIIETPLNFNWDESFGRLATFERQAEWESFMSNFQDVSEDKQQASEQKWQLMERIFSLEDCLKIR